MKTIYDKLSGYPLRVLSGNNEFIALNYDSRTEGVFDGAIPSGYAVDPSAGILVDRPPTEPEIPTDFPNPVSFTDFFRAYTIGGVHLDLFMQHVAAQLDQGV